MASVGNAKAMIGTIFLQYCSYSVFYLLDEMVKIAPSMYRPLIKEQEQENGAVPDFLKKTLDKVAEKGSGMKAGRQ